MARSDRGPTTSSKQLMQVLRDSPALPAFVRTLQPAVLKRLIEHVGLRDAGDLIALTTTRQLREIFEESLWQTLVPGQAEAPRPEVFLQWLDVMLEVGAAFAAERLIELGDTFAVLHLGPLIRVREPGLQEPSDGEPVALLGNYLVTPRHEDEWDSVRAVLVELDGEDAGFLQRVLARCCHRASVRGFSDDGEALLHDESYAREHRRERRGFVTPVMAALFLKTARQTPLQELAASTGYDDVCRRYFEQSGGLEQSGAAEAMAPEAEERDDGAAAAAVSPLQRRALEQALAQAEIISETPRRLLSGPTAAGDEAVLELQLHLDRLQQTQPDVFSARLAELVFLANVLMAGSWYQGKRFSEADAAHAALACANLGLDHVVAATAATAADSLATAPGIVRLFQIGWHLLQNIPMRCADALLGVLQDPHVRDQLSHKRWILEEVDSALHHPPLTWLIEHGEFEEAGESLVLLSLVLDARAHHCLRVLIADFPRYPRQLDAGFEHARLTTQSSRFVKSVHDLRRVEALLQNLDGLLKL